MVTASSARKSSFGLVGLLKRNPKFARVWYSEIVSGFGDWFNLIATATLIEILTGTTSALGWLFALRMMSPFLVSPFAGVLADRFNRKCILIWSDILRGVVVLCFLLVQSAEDVWLLYVLTALQLGLSGLFVPARNAILAEIVLNKDLGDANAVSSTTYAVMQARGGGSRNNGRLGRTVRNFRLGLSHLCSLSNLPGRDLLSAYCH
jgi:Major Facilitator Superfamily.